MGLMANLTKILITFLILMVVKTVTKMLMKILMITRLKKIKGK